MSILTVGSGQQYGTLKAAVAAAKPGDTIQVQAGTYTNDFAYIDKALTIQGVGGMAHFKATVPPTNGKGILTTNADVVLENIELSGAKVADRNGAGVRVEGGTLTLVDTYFHHNENGILANSATRAVIIRDSEFAFNGAGDGYSHGIYVAGQKLEISGSYFHDTAVGHEIKSRAAVTTITDSRIYDLSGTASYSIDLPNGGVAVVKNNVIEQGAASQNPAIVSFGVEGNLHAGSSLTFSDNVIVNSLGKGTGVLNATKATVTLDGNDLYGMTAAQLVSGPAKVTGTTVLATKPALDTSAPWHEDVAQAPGQGTPQVPGSPAPATVFGSGPDALELHVSADAFRGDALMTVKVDGVTYGGAGIAVDAAHAKGEVDHVTIRGDWGPGAHTVSVSFTNDLWVDGVGDRNLYVDGISYNGAALSGVTTKFSNNGTKSFGFTDGQAAAPDPAIVLGSGPDALELRVSADVFRGDALMTVKVDGVAYGGAGIAVDAAHTKGEVDHVTIRGDWGSGAHTVSVSFVNDLWVDGVGDRNLYVDGISYNGAALSNAAAKFSNNGTRSFGFTDGQAATPAPDLVLGSGPDVLTLRVSADAFRGDALMTVKVDGVAYGGTGVHVDAAHGAGDFDTVAIRGNWAPGTHTVSIGFTNDLWVDGVGDRNLYVDGIAYNGAEIAGAEAAFRTNGTQSFAFADHTPIA